MKTYEDLGIEVMFNVAYSPALNIIESIFGELKTEIRKNDQTDTKKLLIECRKYLMTINESKITRRIK